MIPLLRRPDANQRAYFAGYFDAEGSLGVFPANAGRSWCTRINFGQTNPAVLRQLHSFYGGTLGQTRRQHANWRSQTHWVLSRFNIIACFLEDLRPHLGEKRDQVEAVLSRFSTRMPAPDARKLIRDLKRMKKTALTARHLPAAVKRPRRMQVHCEADACHRPARAQRLCTLHYQRARAAGTLPVLQPNRGARVFERPTVAPTELAYFAGYFDGDGSVDLRQHSSTWHLAIAFNQTRFEALLRMHAVYGGNLRFCQKQLPRRHQLKWSLTKREAVLAFLRDVQPHVIEKTREVNLLLSEYTPTLNDLAGQALSRELCRGRARRGERQPNPSGDRPH
jgi:hypothetical protein